MNSTEKYPSTEFICSLKFHNAAIKTIVKVNKELEDWVKVSKVDSKGTTSVTSSLVPL